MSSSYLTDALADTDRMYANASKAVGSSAGAMLTGDMSPSLSLGHSQLSRAKEQYSHFRGVVYSAVKAIASRIAGQDVHVGRLTTRPSRKKLHLPSCYKSIGDSIEPLADHELLTALENPNPTMVTWSLMWSSVASLMLCGRSFWWITEDQGKLQVWPIPSHWIRPSDPLRGSWLMRPTGMAEEIELPSESIVPFVLPNPADPFSSISPLQSQAHAVAVDEAISVAQHKAFQQGIFPGFAIRVGRLEGMQGEKGVRPVLTGAQRQELVSTVLKLYGGAGNRNNPIILDGMIEGIDKITNSPEEMSFSQSAKDTAERILTSFGVSSAVLGSQVDSNRASAVVAQQTFCESTCNPIVTMMSQTITRWARTWFAEKLVCWISECSTEDRELSLQEWNSAKSSGYVTQNEYRRHVLNLPDAVGGDVYRDSLGNPIERSFIPENRLNGHSKP